MGKEVISSRQNGGKITVHGECSMTYMLLTGFVTHTCQGSVFLWVGTLSRGKHFGR